MHASAQSDGIPEQDGADEESADEKQSRHAATSGMCLIVNANTLFPKSLSREQKEGGDEQHAEG